MKRILITFQTAGHRFGIEKMMIEKLYTLIFQMLDNRLTLKRIYHHLMIGYICFLLTSCNKPDNLSEESKVTITQAVENRVNGYAEAVKRHDTDWLLNFWSSEKDFVIADDGELVADYESGIAKPTRDFISNLKEVLYFEFSNGHAYVLNENAASYTTNFDWGVVLLSGDTIKSRGTWLIR